MAPKRPPLDDPPSASSTEEEQEEEEISGGEYEDEDENQEKQEEIEDEGDEEEDESQEIKPFIRNHTPITVEKSQSSVESDPCDGSDIDSPSVSGFTIKPIVSKLMDDRMKLPKSSSKTLKAPAKDSNSKAVSKPAPKRPAETEKKSRAKRSKASVVDEDGASEHKGSVTRLWNEESEITILKGMVDFKSEKGDITFADMGNFHEFIKKSLPVDVSKSQLVSKIKRLKKKYKTNAEKGENPFFSKPHEHESFQLSKKIWGSEGSRNPTESNGKTSKKPAIVSGKVKISAEEPKEKPEEVVKVKTEAQSCDFWSTYPGLDKQIQMQKGLFLSMSSSVENSVRQAMPSIGAAKANELELKWNNLQIGETELYLKRVELIGEQTKLVLSEMKKLPKFCG